MRMRISNSLTNPSNLRKLDEFIIINFNFSSKFFYQIQLKRKENQDDFVPVPNTLFWIDILIFYIIIIRIMYNPHKLNDNKS